MEKTSSEQYTSKEFETHIELFNPEKENHLKTDSECPLKKFRILGISDTHCFEDRMTLPAADLLVVPGDFTCNGAYEELQNFSDFLSREKPKFEKIVVVPGKISTGPDLICRQSRNDSGRVFLQQPKDTLPRQLYPLKKTGHGQGNGHHDLEF